MNEQEITFNIKPENIEFKDIGKAAGAGCLDGRTVDGCWTIMKAALVNITSMAAGMRAELGEDDMETEISMMEDTFKAIRNILASVAARTTNHPAAMNHNEQGERTDVPPYKRMNNN